MNQASLNTGPIAWMVNNRVTPNLLMLFLLCGGLILSMQIRKEVFPEFILDTVNIRVVYPGATPEEVEQGIVLAIEKELRGIEGVKHITARASKGSAMVSAELMNGASPDRTLQEIEQAVGRISTFPEEAEKPVITLANRKRAVVDLVLYGNVDEIILRDQAEIIRSQLLQSPGITQTELDGARDYEIQVKIDRDTLRRYQLTLSDVANTIRNSALDLSSGTLKTKGGEISLQIQERRDWARDFATIPLRTSAAGGLLTLGDVASIKDGFEDSDIYHTWNGNPSITITVFRVGDQTPVGISDAVRAVLPAITAGLAPGINLVVADDDSDIYRERMNLLLKNAFMGLLLVLIVLGLFLEFRLAFWVTMGIPTSFLGALLILPGLDISINVVSMFAFIVALGIVVDDAIIAGENIHENMQQGMDFREAAIVGTRQIAAPLTFSILTNVAAFLPILFLPGFLGKIFMVIPTVVITVFLISWIEALFILPTHLAWIKKHPASQLACRLDRFQKSVDCRLQGFIRHRYQPAISQIMHHRYLSMAIGIALLMIAIAYMGSGRLGFTLMPRIESDRAAATATLPYGSPLGQAEAVREHLEHAALAVAENNGGDRLLRSIEARINNNQIKVFMHLQKNGVRPINTADVTRLWREAVGSIPGIQGLVFSSTGRGPGGRSALTVELSHHKTVQLIAASEQLTRDLARFQGVSDIENTFTAGKPQLNVKIRPEGRSLGLTARDLAHQVRSSFYGAQAFRQQRGSDEVRVMVRLPEYQRSSEYDLEQLMIRTPTGDDVPLFQVADVVRDESSATIHRRNNRRIVDIKANITPLSETSQTIATLKKSVFPALQAAYPGLKISLQGRQADERESLSSMATSGALAMMILYLLLAIPFRSYSQPFIVMAVIPFGIVGAVIGHVLMGYTLSMVSLFGIVALCGVVVNDSLIMVDYANQQQRQKALTGYDAIQQAGVRRFRPIMLTTITTFGGLAPMIFETSRQARFMIPMAISLGFGILFATLITLILLPCLYGILEDIKALLASDPDPGSPGHQSSTNMKPSAGQPWLQG